MMAIFLGEKSNLRGEEVDISGAARFRGDTNIFAGEHGKLPCID
jgi:hypothetical protein